MDRKIPVTAVADIGKTNKKFFLFDEDFMEISHEYIRFEEKQDDDGYPVEDLDAIVNWVKERVVQTIADGRYDLRSLNFSTYGASMVHLDGAGNPVVPFYNYLKPFPEGLIGQLLEQLQVPEAEFSAATSSPIMGFLNSGFQLLYLRHQKPGLFSRIAYSLHFPQYLSFLFSGKYCSEYTSIGCHTALWDFTTDNYHAWLTKEEVISLLPRIVPSNFSYQTLIEGHQIRIGTGVHDSSSALVPYIQASRDPFILISTGTWSICMNYFNEDPLTVEDLNKDCLNFLSTKGTRIKASRLFLGQHISNQMKKLSAHFHEPYSNYKSVVYDSTFTVRSPGDPLRFDHSLLRPERFGLVNADTPDYEQFGSYQHAYHHFIDEVTDLQIASLQLAIGQSNIHTLYVDGGFSKNEVFMQLLANKLPNHQVYASSFAQGTALGAAILINDATLPENYLRENYQLKRYEAMKYSENNPD